MRFFVISDLHLDVDFNITKAKALLKDLCSRIRAEIPQEKILFIFLGDIINAGNVSGFDSARSCLHFIQEELPEYDVRFEFVPGNHDSPAGDIEPFDKFIAEFGVNHSFESSGAYSEVYDDVNFIFADSIRHREHSKAGELDLDAIKKNIKSNMQNILFCHHAFAQSHGGSHDSIEDSAACLKILADMSISFVFHGHTHRADEARKFKKIIEIGCGSLFDRADWLDELDIQNQFTTGGIRDGRIVDVGRCILSRDGSDIFPYAALYPVPRLFKDLEKSNKIKYDAIPYIKRKVFTHSHSLKDAFSFGWYHDKGCSLQEALLTDRNILLLSDAGMGKSIELNNLAYQLYHSSLFPFLYELRNYTNEKIEDLIPPEYNSLAPHRRALIFDGYDELPDNLRRVFENRLNSYVKENPQAYVVMSSRRNFCRINENNESNVFPGFKAYILWSLNDNDVESYLESECVDVSAFMANASEKRLSELLFNPFYLIELVNVYKKKGELPNRSALMRELINGSFAFDDRKFYGELGDRYNELYELLKKLAFSMQLMRKSRLDDYTEYQKLLVNKADRDLLKHCGLLQMSGSSWSFSHNNFREYLSAEYLSELHENDVKSYVANEDGIYPSWLNTLGFLISLEYDWDIIEWLTDFCPEALVKSEPDRVGELLRFQIFEKIFLNHEQEGLWFDSEYCTEEELAHFAQSNDTLTFLLTRISNPINVRAQHTAINVLRYFSHGLYGRRDEVLSCLINCCESFPETSGNTCRIALFAIAQLKLHSKEITDKIVSIFSDSDNDFIRLGVYEYLLKTNEHNRHVQFFLDGIKYVSESANDDTRIANEHYQLEQGLKAMSTSASISTALRWYRNKNRPNLYNDNKILDSLLISAARRYLAGDSEMFEHVFACFIDTQNNLEYELTRCFVPFFETTGTAKKAALLSTEYPSEANNCVLFLQRILPDTIRHILNAYSAGEYNDHEQFIFIVQEYADYDIYAECAEAIKVRTGVSIPNPRPRKDYDAIRRRGQQEYFDALFSKDRFEIIFNTLLENINNPEMKVGDLFDTHFGIEEINSPWNLLRVAIYHNCLHDLLVSDFLRKTNFEIFIIHEWERMLKKQSELVITEEQKSVIKIRVSEMLEAGILAREISHRAGQATISLLCQDLIVIAKLFDTDLSDAVYLDMVNVPAFCFGEKQTSKEKYDYLRSHISDEQILERVADNIRSGTVSLTIIHDHIEFCTEAKSNVAVDIALSICKSVCDKTWIRNSALYYLYTLYGGEYICRVLLPDADGDFLLEIARVCPNISDVKLCQAMEREFLKNPSLGLWEALLYRRNKTAFLRYVESVEKFRHPPEYQNESGYSPTKAFTGISDIEALPLLGRLIKVVFSDDFKDNSVHTLKTSLKETLINCGKKEPEKVIALIESHSANAISDSDKFFFSYVAKEIRNINKKACDKALSMRETREIVFSS